MSNLTRFLRPLALVVLLAGWHAGSHAPRFVRGQIAFEERVWSRGSLPTLDFTVSAGLLSGTADKVEAYLYFSEEPEAVMTTPFPRVFVGIIPVPGSVNVTVFAPPQRGPINAHSRESFVQGQIFNVTTGAPLGTTNITYLDIDYDAPPDVFELDFETEDDFKTSLANGQDLSTPPEFGRLLSINSLQPSMGAAHFGPAIFDSDPEGPNAEGPDPDLLVGRGNVVILQGNDTQEVPGFFDTPDDSAGGGTLVFDFTGFDLIEKVRPISLDLIDIAEGEDDDLVDDDERGTEANVTLIDVLGNKRIIHVPAGWTGDVSRDESPGFRTLDLTTFDPQPGFQGMTEIMTDPEYIEGEIVRIEVELTGSGSDDDPDTLDDEDGVDGSGAIDNLVFEREADPGTSVGMLKR